jgi:hypothetical protein
LITIGGIMYSEAAPQRMAIVNSEVAQEGMRVGEVEVLRIEPNAVVVRAQGQRIRIPAR